jgi:hypothetical protein
MSPLHPGRPCQDEASPAHGRQPRGARGARHVRCNTVSFMAESEPGGEIARSELRASHDDRDRVVEMLRVSAGETAG